MLHSLRLCAGDLILDQHTLGAGNVEQDLVGVIYGTLMFFLSSIAGGPSFPLLRSVVNMARFQVQKPVLLKSRHYTERFSPAMLDGRICSRNSQDAHPQLFEK